jgi:hypothetical protein
MRIAKPELKVAYWIVDQGLHKKEPKVSLEGSVLNS